MARFRASVAWHLVQYYNDIFSTMPLNAFVRWSINIIIFTLLRIAVKSLILMWVNVHVTVINRKLLRALENIPHRQPRLTEWENAVRTNVAAATYWRAHHVIIIIKFSSSSSWASQASLFTLRYSSFVPDVPVDDTRFRGCCRSMVVTWLFYLRRSSIPKEFIGMLLLC